jgi:hypothetical protein
MSICRDTGTVANIWDCSWSGNIQYSGTLVKRGDLIGRQSSASTFQDCLTHYDNNPNCNAVNYSPGICISKQALLATVKRGVEQQPGRGGAGRSESRFNFDGHASCNTNANVINFGCGSLNFGCGSLNFVR